jgi:biopolymer transport protein ExbB
VLARSGVSRPSGITAGIAEALLATATGLVIAIFTLIAFNYFQDRVKQITGEIEMRSTQLANLVSRRHEEPARAPEAQRV